MSEGLKMGQVMLKRSGTARWQGPQAVQKSGFDFSSYRIRDLLCQKRGDG